MEHTFISQTWKTILYYRHFRVTRGTLGTLDREGQRELKVTEATKDHREQREHRGDRWVVVKIIIPLISIQCEIKDVVYCHMDS